jgi:hypothetical protein
VHLDPNDVKTLIVVGILIGLIGGRLIGRWWAENSRARYDMNRTWRQRQDYRR